jgi:hypothetical protein
LLLFIPQVAFGSCTLWTEDGTSILDVASAKTRLTGFEFQQS